MTTSRLLVVSCLAACSSSGGTPAVPITPTTALGGVDVQQVLIATPTLSEPEVSRDMQPLETQRSVVGLVMTSRYQCDISKALELREYEGSILGSQGVDVAVTYFVPILRHEQCELTKADIEYRIAVDWERRTDTPWTIVVPGYRGSDDRVPNTALFAKNLTGYKAVAATETALQSIAKIGEHPLASMTNAGAIKSVKTERDKATGDVLISITVSYGNSCEAETPWRLEPIVWAPDANGVANVFVTLEPPPSRKACGEIAQLSPPPLATSHVRITPPKGATSVAVVIPTKPGGRDLPVFSTQLALR